MSSARPGRAFPAPDPPDERKHDAARVDQPLEAGQLDALLARERQTRL